MPQPPTGTTGQTHSLTNLTMLLKNPLFLLLCGLAPHGKAQWVRLTKESLQPLLKELGGESDVQASEGRWRAAVFFTKILQRQF